MEGVGQATRTVKVPLSKAPRKNTLSIICEAATSMSRKNASIVTELGYTSTMYFLYFVISITILQEALFGFLGLTGTPLFVMRALADQLSILIFFYAILRNLSDRIPLTIGGTGYERLFIIFFGYSISISILTTQSNFSTNLAEIIVLNRFIFLSLTVPMIANTQIKLEKLLRFVWLMIALQATIGFIQKIGGIQVIDLFRPNDYFNVMTGSERSFTSNRGLNRQMLIGTVGDFITFGYLMFVGIIILLSKRIFTIKASTLLVCFLALIFFSGSRTIFLSALLVTAVYLFTKISIRWRLLAVFSGAAIAPWILSVIIQMSAGVEFEYSTFLALFRPEFIESLMQQRLGHALLYLPNLVKDPVVIFGLSPDRVFATEYVLKNFGDVLPYVFMTTFIDTLEDFYPAALITYYGLIGSTLFYAMHFLILRSAWQDRLHQDPLVARLARIAVLLIFSTHLLSLGNQSFENRGLSLMLWLSVGMYMSIRIIKRRATVSARVP
jgi:hypothetical protein